MYLGGTVLPGGPDSCGPKSGGHQCWPNSPQSHCDSVEGGSCTSSNRTLPSSRATASRRPSERQVTAFRSQLSRYVASTLPRDGCQKRSGTPVAVTLNRSPLGDQARLLIAAPATGLAPAWPLADGGKP